MRILEWLAMVLFSDETFLYVARLSAAASRTPTLNDEQDRRVPLRAAFAWPGRARPILATGLPEEQLEISCPSNRPVRRYA
jgi:hypothetical protein